MMRCAFERVRVCLCTCVCARVCVSECVTRCVCLQARPRKVLPEWWEAAAVACVRVVVVWLVCASDFCLSTGWCSPGAVLHAAAHAQASAASRITYRQDPVIGQ